MTSTTKMITAAAHDLGLRDQDVQQVVLVATIHVVITTVATASTAVTTVYAALRDAQRTNTGNQIEHSYNRLGCKDRAQETCHGQAHHGRTHAGMSDCQKDEQLLKAQRQQDSGHSLPNVSGFWRKSGWPSSSCFKWPSKKKQMLDFQQLLDERSATGIGNVAAAG